MKGSFLDLEYMRRAVEQQEAMLTVKTGIRAGDIEPAPLYIAPDYGVPEYGVLPDATVR
jgi:hypothetical protein